VPPGFGFVVATSGTWWAMILAWTQYLPRQYGGGQCIVHGKTLWQQVRTPEGSLAYAPVCEAPDSEAPAILEMALNGTLQVVVEAGQTPKAVIPAHCLPQAGQPVVLQPGATQATAGAPTPVAQAPVAQAPVAEPPVAQPQAPWVTAQATVAPQTAVPRAVHEPQMPLEAGGQNPVLPPVPQLGHVVPSLPPNAPSSVGSVYVNIPMPVLARGQAAQVPVIKCLTCSSCVFVKLARTCI